MHATYTNFGVGIARMILIGAYTRKLRAMLENCTNSPTVLSDHSRLLSLS